VRCRVAGVAAETTLFVHQRDIVAGPFQQVSGGDAGDARPDDKHVDRYVFF
jgi:hypothetical protein